VFAPPGQEEAQVQTAAELAAGDSYDYGGDGSDVSNPYLGVASNETINQLQNAVKNAYSRGQEDFFPVLTFDQFNALKGTTLANPFRTDPSRGGIASFLARNLDYRGQRDTLDDLQRQYAMFVNPTGQLIDVPTINSLKLDNASTTALLKDQIRLLERPSDQGDGSEGKLRAGLQTEYGTLFGSPVGTPTVFGDVKAQVPPMSPGEMAARIGAAATPVGFFTSLGGQKEFTTERSPTYDPRLDPNSELYEGPRGGILGTLLDTITGGAGTSALKQGSDFLKSSEGGFNLKDLVSGIFSSNQGQKAQEEMKNIEDQTGSNVKLGPESFLNKEPFPLNSNVNAKDFLNKEPFPLNSNVNAKDFLNVKEMQENANKIRREAIEAYKNPETRLSNNLTMHIERYKIRNR